MRLVLFDVDGTLVAARGAGRRAMIRALRAIYGVTGPAETYGFSGKTDPTIVADLLGAAGLDSDEIAAQLPAFYDRYLVELGAEIGDGEHVTLMPGIGELIPRLSADPGALVGLLTGNIEGGARIKLEPTGLWPYFRLGAYGSDDPNRSRLPAVAVRRAEALVERPVKPVEVVVIGDTPLDIGCARAFGAVALAVATGQHSLAELAAFAPDFLFADLSDVPRVLAALFDGGPRR
ncbi:MAG: haloacid dehalogenase-like hydrolase [Candidatus Rokubacteria bacterium]|nr:haloacid dehalogenase-like hydrolase [Candidatus Rokubacteria bacterium]